MATSPVGALRRPDDLAPRPDTGPSTSRSQSRAAHQVRRGPVAQAHRHVDAVLLAQQPRLDPAVEPELGRARRRTSECERTSRALLRARPLRVAPGHAEVADVVAREAALEDGIGERAAPAAVEGAAAGDLERLRASALPSARRRRRRQVVGCAQVACWPVHLEVGALVALDAAGQAHAGGAACAGPPARSTARRPRRATRSGRARGCGRRRGRRGRPRPRRRARPMLPRGQASSTSPVAEAPSPALPMSKTACTSASASTSRSAPRRRAVPAGRHLHVHEAGARQRGQVQVAHVQAAVVPGHVAGEARHGDPVELALAAVDAALQAEARARQRHRPREARGALMSKPVRSTWWSSTPRSTAPTRTGRPGAAEPAPAGRSR